MNEQAKVEQLKEQEEIKTALKQTPGTKETIPPPVPELRDKLWFGTYVLVLLVLLAIYYLLGSDLVPTEAGYIPNLRALVLGAISVVITLAVARGIHVYWINQIDNKPARYNLTRVLNLLTFLAIIVIGLTVVSANWYTALVSLGVLSLILGFALQTPITSLIGWVYLLIRQPYRVGDRIEIAGARGDVIDVNYLDTTLWEFGGPYLSTQHPSGRIVKFPNSLVLNETVYNYSWPLFPYVWNEIKFNIAYDSDLAFVAQAMTEVVQEELGEKMLGLVGVYRELLKQTPV
ncbi:MAG TPA: mechanosensitive ion channel family protein, partial [Anaerolineales bacterium]|nr:mechanosensitive ion channel family protein [Anaerolineales bacterium]